MITARFINNDEQFIGFEVSGHSGYADSGSDIVCATVTAYTQLTIDLLEQSFGMALNLTVNEENASIFCYFKSGDKAVFSSIVHVLKSEIMYVSNEYPKNVLVK